jgi:uncharacterized protein (TIGR02466 family)
MIENIFPTAIGKWKDVSLANKIYPVAKKILENPENRSDTWGYRTTYGNNQINLTDFEPFIPELKQYVNMYLSETGYEEIKEEYLTVYPFVSEMMMGDYHNTHDHPNSRFSGIIYLNVAPNSAPLRFWDNRPAKKWTIYPTNNNTQYSKEYYDYPPEVGDILIWEGYMDHQVPQNYSGSRVALVFNVVTPAPNDYDGITK